MSRLIITNGDSAAQRIDALGHADFVLPWRDVLHEGPVLPCDSLRKQSIGRAAFIAGFADMPEPDVAHDFTQRDDVFLQAVGEDETHIELWFEHDLYDQLQLMQILDVLYRQFPIKDVYLVQADFYLAEIANEDFRILPQQAVKITASQKEYGAKAWQAFVRLILRRLKTFWRKMGSCHLFIRHYNGCCVNIQMRKQDCRCPYLMLYRFYVKKELRRSKKCFITCSNVKRQNLWVI